VRASLPCVVDADGLRRVHISDQRLSPEIDRE